MNKYKYFYKNDDFQEAVGVINAYDREEAIVIASELKKLSIDDFLSIFNIKKLI
jgi:hypothetical protein